MITKTQEKEQARLLRQQGLSLAEISKKIEIPKSTVRSWVKDIELTEGQIKNLETKGNSINTMKRISAMNVERFRNLRKQYQEEGKQYALKNDLLHLKGCMLYWAEGAKSRGTCKFANTDPHMITLFKGFLDKTFDLDKSKYSVHVNYYTNNGLTLEDIENYWLNLLDLPRSCLRKSTAKNDLKEVVKKVVVTNTHMEFVI